MGCQEFKVEKRLLFENQKYRRSIHNFRLNTSGIPEVTGRYKGLEMSIMSCLKK